MIQTLKKIFLPVIPCAALAVCAAGCTGSAVLYESTVESDGTSSTQSSDAEAEDEDMKGEAPEETLLYVYVCGEVENPGVYTLPEGSRICDAVDAAGGMTEEASATYLNLAELLTDGQMIEVPSNEEAALLEEEAAQAASSLININTATEDELMTLTGIGEAKAKAIIAYREENGDFEDIEDLMEISGIKEGVFNQIKDQITV